MSVFFFWVHGEWIVARNKQINREPLRGSRDLFVPTLRFIPYEPRKKDNHSLIDKPSIINRTELQIIFESNAYLRPYFLLNADFQISKSIFTPCNFSQCWKGRYYRFEVPYLNFFWCNFNFSFGSDLLLLVITLEYILTIFWQYVDKRTDW